MTRRERRKAVLNQRRMMRMLMTEGAKDQSRFRETLNELPWYKRIWMAAQMMIGRV